ncbi:MAG: acyl-CoA dehydrogenase family protein [Rhodospirillales bacterium]
MTGTSEMANILAETAGRLLEDHVTREVLGAAEEGTWPEELWRVLEENGLTQPLAPEARGGMGATFADAFVIAFAAGRKRAPVPLVETMAAGWLLGMAGIDVPSGPLALIDGSDGLDFSDGVLSGTAEGVPWASRAGHLVAEVDGTVLLIPSDAATISPDVNMAGDGRDTVTFAKAEPAASGLLPAKGSVSVSRLLGAVMRAAQMAGAMEWAVALTVSHVCDREQFGRPLAKFQAIQQMLSRAAARAAQARSAAETAFLALDRAGDDLANAEWDIAAAKVVAGEAADIVYDAAHQSHGAIGFTYEHELHFTTRRLWAWRGEFGAETYWAEEIGRRVLARGAENMWPDLTERQKG